MLVRVASRGSRGAGSASGGGGTTTWLLEAYGTDSRYGDDVRYRAYTTSEKKAEAFKRIPRIQFSDSGHGVVFWAEPLPRGAKRLPLRHGLSDYVREHYLSAENREPTVKEVCEMIDLNPSSVWEWLRFLRGEAEHPAQVRRLRDAKRKA